MTLTDRAGYPEALGAEATPKVLPMQEWLAQRVADLQAGSGGPFRLLPHCTEASTATAALRDWATVFKRASLRRDILRAGCRGMAGTSGHEAAHREVSERIYDLSWRRRLADASGGEALATGCSCRSQARRLDRAALRHPPRALLAALRVAGRPVPFP